MDRLADVMEKGIDETTPRKLDEAGEARGRTETTASELESQRGTRDKLSKEIDDAARILNRSREIMAFDPAMLKDAVEVGLELSGATSLRRIEGADEYELPEMSESWQPTLDTLRPPRGRTEPFWEWRQRKPMPVVFRALARMDGSRVHLHLQHPFVQRIPSRFLAQGYSAQDLSRVTIVRNPGDALAQVIAFGRLSLFGPGAVRLHDQLVSVAAR
jgi:hypothetical protein